MRIRGELALPFHLDLPDGRHPPPDGLDLRSVDSREESIIEGNFIPVTLVSMESSMPAEIISREDAEEKFFQESIDDFLARINRLLRWYRVVARDPGITEVTKIQVGTVSFVSLDSPEPRSWGRSYGGWLSSRPAPEILAANLIEGLSSQGDPDVVSSLQLDARYASREGRFREAVLLAWSAIETSFHRKYDILVERKLEHEYAESRRFFLSPDFGLRNKMTAGLDFVAGKSLFREPGDFWKELSTSYNTRNGIIHSGGGASPADAERAIRVAERIEEIRSYDP